MFETVRLSALSDAVARDDFLRTTAGWVGLDHPNVHRLYEAWQCSDTSVMLVREFTDALDLGTVLDRLSTSGKRLTPSIALYVARAIAVALTQAHQIDVGTRSGGMTHGDVTAGDILLTASGLVCLTGYGRVLLSGTTSSTAGQLREAQDVGQAMRLLELMLISSEPRQQQKVQLPPDIRPLVDDAHQGTLSAAALAHRLESLPEFLSDDDATIRIARLVGALQTDKELEERGRLLRMRGSPGAAGRVVTATQVTPITTRMPTPAASGYGMSGSAPHSSDKSNSRSSSGGFLIAGLMVAVVVILWLWWSGQFSVVGDRTSDAGGGITDSTAYDLYSLPSGASVSIDGELVGLTPYAFEHLSTGPLTLRLEYPGFRPIDTVLIIKNPNEIEAITQWVFEKRVRFSSIPGGARVHVDGRELSDGEAADFWVLATDTILVEYELRNEQPMAPAFLSPTAGLIEPTDTTIWHWTPDRELHGGELLAQFEQMIRIRSLPEGALVYLDGDTVPVGTTELMLPMVYGRHRARLVREPCLDYVFDLAVGRDSPGLYTIALQRAVHIRTTDARDPDREISARIDWIRRNKRYIRTPADELTTPYSLLIDGYPHEVHLSGEGFADTTVLLGSEIQFVDIALIPSRGPQSGGDPDHNQAENAEGWVRFLVKGNQGPVAGAEVIGIEKQTGLTLSYGLTDAAGEFLTRVPVGDYDWHATKSGFEGRSNGERIRGGRGLKQITLRLHDRGH